MRPHAWSRASLLGLALFVCGRTLPAQGRASAPDAYEEGIFEVVVPGMVATQLGVLVSPRGVYLLPLRAALEPLGVPLTVLPDSQLVRVARPGGTGVRTLRWGPLAAAGADSLRLGPTEVTTRGAEVYVAAPRLAQLIESTVDVDLATLTVRIQRPGGYPAQLFANVRQRRGRAMTEGASMATGPIVPVPFVPRTGIGVLELALTGTGTPIGVPRSVSTRAGMGLYGGMLKLGGAITLPGTPGAGFGYQELSYQRVFPFGEFLRQLQVGDIFSEGAVARPIRGLSITNAPFVRSQRFGDLAFSRPLPPGWEYDVFEGERLVGYADAGTRTAVPVPVQYGTTPLKVRLYGPAGEVVESVVTYVIPVDQLPAGDWQYSAGGGRCAVGQCDGTGYADVRRGLSSALTVQLGADGTRDSGATTLRPYGAVSFLPAPGWTTQVQARRQAFLRGVVQRYGDQGTSGAASFGVNARGEGGTSVGRDSGATLFAQASVDLLHAIPRLGDHGLSLSSRVEHPQGGGAGRWDVSSYVQLTRGMLELGLQSDPLRGISGAATGTPMLRIAPTVSVFGSQGSRLGSPILRTELGFQGLDVTQYDVGLSLQPGHGQVNLSLRHLVGVPGTLFNVGGSVALGTVRTVSHLVERGGRLDGTYTASGAVAFGTMQPVTPLTYGGLGLSGVEGVVYRDLNGNGTFDEGDLPEPNVTVAIGGLRTVTNARGRYTAWNAMPYELLAVQMDSLSLEDPSWTPVLALHTLRPSPQQYTRIDFPLVHTREAIGRIVGASGVPVGGVALELRGEGSGAFYTVRTFGDGAFYFSRVRPGRYTVTLSAASARVLGAEIAPGTALVVPSAGDEVTELPPIVLTSTTPVPSPATPVSPSAAITSGASTAPVSDGRVSAPRTQVLPAPSTARGGAAARRSVPRRRRSATSRSGAKPAARQRPVPRQRVPRAR